MFYVADCQAQTEPAAPLIQLTKETETEKGERTRMERKAGGSGQVVLKMAMVTSPRT